MLIPKSAASNFPPRPVGAQLAIIADISDSFESVNPIDGGIRSQFIMTFQLAATYVDPNGKHQRYLHSEFYTASLGKKAKLRKLLEGLLSRELDDKEIPDNFDTNNFLGKSVILNLIKGQNDYVKMQSITAIPAGTPRLTVDNYTRPQWILDHIANAQRTVSVARQANATASTNVSTASAAVASSLGLGTPSDTSANAGLLNTPVIIPSTPTVSTPLSLDDVLKQV